jgi:hypothetical protein
MDRGREGRRPKGIVLWVVELVLLAPLVVGMVSLQEPRDPLLGGAMLLYLAFYIVAVRWLGGSGRRHSEPPGRDASHQEGWPHVAAAVDGRAGPSGAAWGGSVPSGTLRVTRKHQPWHLWGGKLHVEVDGARAGSLVEGASVELELPVGSHDVRVRLARDWGGQWGAARLPVEPGTTTHVLASTDRAAWDPFGSRHIGYQFEDASVAEIGTPVVVRRRTPWLFLGSVVLVYLVADTLTVGGRAIIDYVPGAAPIVWLILLIGVPTVGVTQLLHRRR